MKFQDRYNGNRFHGRNILPGSGAVPRTNFRAEAQRFVGNSFPSICIFLLIYQLSYRRKSLDEMPSLADVNSASYLY